MEGLPSLSLSFLGLSTGSRAWRGETRASRASTLSHISAEVNEGKERKTRLLPSPPSIETRPMPFFRPRLTAVRCIRWTVVETLRMVIVLAGFSSALFSFGWACCFARNHPEEPDGTVGYNSDWKEARHVLGNGAALSWSILFLSLVAFKALSGKEERTEEMAPLILIGPSEEWHSSIP
jgi:hypothetical protein